MGRDLPQALEVQGGWLNSKTIDAFVEYANLTFTTYGDRVKQWSTFNEPYCSSWLGYGVGVHAPGHCSDRLIFLIKNLKIQVHLSSREQFNRALHCCS